MAANTRCCKSCAKREPEHRFHLLRARCRFCTTTGRHGRAFPALEGAKSTSSATTSFALVTPSPTRRPLRCATRASCNRYVTRPKRARSLRAEAERRVQLFQRYADFFESAADGMVVIDREGRVLFAQPARQRDHRLQRDRADARCTSRTARRVPSASAALRLLRGFPDGRLSARRRHRSRQTRRKTRTIANVSFSARCSTKTTRSCSPFETSRSSASTAIELEARPRSSWRA